MFPFEEGITHLWLGGLIAHLGEEGSKRLREVGSLLGYLTSQENSFLLREMGQPSANHKCCFCPLVSLPCQQGHAPHKLFPETLKPGGHSPPLM